MNRNEEKDHPKGTDRKHQLLVAVLAASALLLAVLVTVLLLFPAKKNAGGEEPILQNDLTAETNAVPVSQQSSAGHPQTGETLISGAALLTEIDAEEIAVPSPVAVPQEQGGGVLSAEGAAMTSVDETGAETVYDEKVESLIEQMTLHEKVCQMIVVTPEALTGVSVATAAGPATQEGMDKMPVGGICFLGQNLQSVEQTQTMIDNLQMYAKEDHGIGLFITLDEEGGRVARVAGKLGTTKFSPMYEYREQGTETARQNAFTIASDIRSVGVNLDLAPVADVWTNPENTVIGKRAYSDDPEQAAELVAAAVQGFHDGGVMCTLKHFPGHGDTKEDSHTGTAYNYRTLEELYDCELKPFISGIDAGADMVMSSHVTLPEIDSLPTTLSPTVLSILRNDLGFEGVIMTDSLSMQALTDHYGYAKIGVLAVLAGNDILLCQNGMPEMVQSIEEAVAKGEISEERINESVRRILMLKMRYGLID